MIDEFYWFRMCRQKTAHSRREEFIDARIQVCGAAVNRRLMQGVYSMPLIPATNDLETLLKNSYYRTEKNASPPVTDKTSRPDFIRLLLLRQSVGSSAAITIESNKFSTQKNNYEK